VLHGLADGLQRLDALEHNGKIGERAQLVVVAPREELGLLAEDVGRSGPVAFSALAVTAGVRVDGPDECLGASLLDATDEGLVVGDVAIEVDLESARVSWLLT
jgi:hypothetical protein